MSSSDSLVTSQGNANHSCDSMATIQVCYNNSCDSLVISEGNCICDKSVWLHFKVRMNNGCLIALKGSSCDSWKNSQGSDNRSSDSFVTSEQG